MATRKPAAKTATSEEAAPKKRRTAKRKPKETTPAEEPGNRRIIPKEYVDAVRRGLSLTGSKADPVTFAKVLWTNTKIEVPGRRASDPKTTIDNPHTDGRNVTTIESTIALMHGIKL